MAEILLTDDSIKRGTIKIGFTPMRKLGEEPIALMYGALVRILPIQWTAPLASGMRAFNAATAG